MDKTSKVDPGHTFAFRLDKWSRVDHSLTFTIRLDQQRIVDPGQTWDLSKNLHKRIFGPKILHTKSAYIATISTQKETA